MAEAAWGRLIRWWQRAAADATVVRDLDAMLRGAGQVLLQAHPLAGLCFLGAIAVGDGLMGIGAAIGLLVATMTGVLLYGRTEAFRQGLYGYNGLLVGAAVTALLVMTPWTWALLVLGAAVTVLVYRMAERLLSGWQLPVLTAPFVLVTLATLLAAPNPLVMQAAAPAAEGVLLVVRGGLMGLGQVFLVGDPIAGILILAGLAVSSRRAAVCAGGGAAVGTAVALLLGGSAGDLAAGTFGFNPALAAIAVGCTFATGFKRPSLAACAAAVIAVPVQMGLTMALAPLGVAPLTGPFVLVTWGLLLIAQRLDCTRHPLGQQ